MKEATKKDLTFLFQVPFRLKSNTKKPVSLQMKKKKKKTLKTFLKTLNFFKKTFLLPVHLYVNSSFVNSKKAGIPIIFYFSLENVS